MSTSNTSPPVTVSTWSPIAAEVKFVIISSLVKGSTIAKIYNVAVSPAAILPIVQTPVVSLYDPSPK